jgi:hypothetical protein
MADAPVINPGCLHPSTTAHKSQTKSRGYRGYRAGMRKNLKTKLAFTRHSAIFDRFRSEHPGGIILRLKQRLD